MSFINRISKDSIKRFRAAVSSRTEDASVLLVNDRPAAGLYFYGYAAEMTLKAAVFRLMGEKPTANIDSSTLRKAEQLGRSLGISKPRNYHDSLWWARLLVRLRAVAQRPLMPPFERRLLAHAQQLESNWRETLRYAANRPRVSELKLVQAATSWLVEQYSLLV
jgi:hypothetical protein